MTKPKHILELFASFLKIGAFTFGGGYAMMPVMHKEVVEKKGWASDEDILKILVISESTPGVLAVNSATYIGYRIGGFWGSVARNARVVLPSFVIISLISLFIVEFKELTWVAYAFQGIRAGVSILILNAVFKLGKKMKRNWFSWLVLATAFLTALFTSFSVIYLLLIAAVFGIVYGAITHAKSEVTNRG
ncbi:MAG: chromate transporter [Bacillus subtilis]|nr:chromate transporter [Bacillus subtilis]